MIVKLTNGFEADFDPEAFNDIRFLELLGEAQENPLKGGVLVRKLLGDEQTEKLYKHLEDDKGRVSVDLVDAAVAEMMEAVPGAEEDSKNSDTSPIATDTIEQS